MVFVAQELLFLHTEKLITVANFKIINNVSLVSKYWLHIVDIYYIVKRNIFFLRCLINIS